MILSRLSACTPDWRLSSGQQERLDCNLVQQTTILVCSLSSFRLALLLAITVALGPLALDTYLPAFPQIASDFNVDLPAVGRTLSVYVLILGVSQLVGGPLSDRYGRRVVLQTGLGIFAVASLMLAGARNLDSMMFWRVIQAIGGAWAAVSVPAIVRDRTSGNESARLFSLIGLIMFAAPALAPSIGSLILHFSTWPGIFVMLAVYALVLAITLRAFLFRNLPAASRTRTPLYTLVTNYIKVLSNGAAMRFVIMQTLAFSVMLIFITHASFIYQDWFGRSNAEFSVLFAANIVGMVIANLLNRKLLLRYHSTRILRAALYIQCIAVIVMLAMATANAGVIAIAAAIIIAAGSMGAIAPNNIANALDFFPKLGGTAAALMGAAQFSIAGMISAISTWLADGTLMPIALVMAACSLGALLFAVGAPDAVRRAVSHDG